MTRKLFKSGNSLVVSIPRDVLDSLHLAEGDEVVVGVDATRQQIVITPRTVATEGVDEHFAQQLAAFIDTYRPALQALAK